MTCLLLSLITNYQPVIIRVIHLTSMPHHLSNSKTMEIKTVIWIIFEENTYRKPWVQSCCQSCCQTAADKLWHSLTKTPSLKDSIISALYLKADLESITWYKSVLWSIFANYWSPPDSVVGNRDRFVRIIVSRLSGWQCLNCLNTSAQPVWHKLSLQCARLTTASPQWGESALLYECGICSCPFHFELPRRCSDQGRSYKSPKLISNWNLIGAKLEPNHTIFRNWKYN